MMLAALSFIAILVGFVRAAEICNHVECNHCGHPIPCPVDIDDILRLDAGEFPLTSPDSNFFEIIVTGSEKFTHLPLDVPVFENISFKNANLSSSEQVGKMKWFGANVSITYLEIHLLSGELDQWFDNALLESFSLTLSVTQRTTLKASEMSLLNPNYLNIKIGGRLSVQNGALSTVNTLIIELLEEGSHPCIDWGDALVKAEHLKTFTLILPPGFSSEKCTTWIPDTLPSSLISFRTDDVPYQITPSMFSSLNQLSIFEMYGNNEITSIPNGAFKSHILLFDITQCPNLAQIGDEALITPPTWFWVKGSALTTIPRFLELEHDDGKAVISIENSKIDCKCDMNWITNGWEQRLSFVALAGGCSSPPELKGVSFHEIVSSKIDLCSKETWPLSRTLVSIPVSCLEPSRGHGTTAALVIIVLVLTAVIVFMQRTQIRQMFMALRFRKAQHHMPMYDME